MSSRAAPMPPNNAAPRRARNPDSPYDPSAATEGT
jgi:hypothetical protein